MDGGGGTAGEKQKQQRKTELDGKFCVACVPVGATKSKFNSK